MARQLYAVIVGCGRLGSFIADQLSAEGNSVVVIDVDEASFRNLSSRFSGFKIPGDATELGVLEQAKIGDADVFIATTRDDNINLMVSQVASRVFKIKRVMARVFDPKREELYRQLGIVTVSPTLLAGENLLARLRE